jgi:predicted transcriptional regulator
LASEHAGNVSKLMLLSIKPHHVNNILSGRKTIELRRVRPQIKVGQPVAVYGTSPMAAVVATCRVHKVEIATPSEIKERHLRRAAISSDDFDTYFSGIKQAVAIHLGAVTPLEHVVTLQQLRLRRSYNPPQTWHFFDSDQLHDLLDGHVSHSALSALMVL